MVPFGDIIAGVGKQFGLPELGISEFLNGGQSELPIGKVTNSLLGAKPNNQGASGVLGANTDVAQPDQTGSVAGGSGVSTSDLAYLDDQQRQLRDLLARTDTGLSQGLVNNEDEYNRNLGQSNADKERQYANYADQRVTQNQGKLDSYDTINKNASNGFRSLAQLIGRASGTGSSAFRDLLPNVIGTDISSKRGQANDTYGENLQGIDKAQNQYDISFADVLDDLLRQKKSNENTLRSGIETQRQDLNSKLGTVAGQRAQALGGGYDQVKAAQQPFQDSINNSRNQVESFFNQFRSAYTPKQAVATAPELSNYTTDRSVINAQNQGATDATNPYAQLLRKRLTGQA